MSCFKFGQKDIASEDFHKQRQITDIFTIGINKVLLSDRMSCNNGRLTVYCRLTS